MYLAGAKLAEPGRGAVRPGAGNRAAAGALLHVPVGLRSTQIVPDTGRQARLRVRRPGPNRPPNFKSAADTPTPAAQSGPSTGDLPATAPCPPPKPFSRGDSITRKPLRRMRPPLTRRSTPRRGHRQTSAAPSRGHRKLWAAPSRGHRKLWAAPSRGHRKIWLPPNRCPGCTGCRRTEKQRTGDAEPGTLNRGHRTVGCQAHATGETCSRRSRTGSAHEIR